MAAAGINTSAAVLCRRCQRRFLEEELARRYRDAAPATLALLQERCEAMAKELIAADGKLQEAGDVVSLRRAGACVHSGSALLLAAVLHQVLGRLQQRAGMYAGANPVAELKLQGLGLIMPE